MKKTKYFTLLSGREDDWCWSIYCVIRRNGTFMCKSDIHLQNSTNGMTPEQVEKRNAYYRIESMTPEQIERKNTQQRIESMTLKQVKRQNELSAIYSAERKGWGRPIILNKWFLGSNLHHLFKKVVAFIPEEIHKSVYHNLEVGIGMTEINKLAIDYVYGN